MGINGPESKCWVVAYTELVLNTAAFVPIEMNDDYRRWAFSTRMMNASDTLGLGVALGNRVNAVEVQGLAEAIENISFLSLPSGWALLCAVESKSLER